ncbi:MAG: tetratricopeptide repeat protein [Anaerolineae bacterium]|nr:tetratricopeptide repeat protein [Anaerolineae bacterium]
MHNRRHLALILLLLSWAVLLIALYPYVALRSSYLKLIRQGDAHAARLERTAAITRYSQAAAIRPDAPQAYLRMAQVYLDWGRAEEAQAALAQASERGADSLEVERLWIAIHTLRAEWPAVVTHAGQLLAHRPTDGAARNALAQALLAMREWERARQEYETILHHNPDDARAHERLGILLAGEDNRLAIEHLLAAHTGLAEQLAALLGEVKNTEPAYVAVLLGQALIEQEEWALAAYHLTRAVTLSPDYADAHTYLGYALDRMGHSDLAKQHLERGIALAPDSPAAHILLGLHYKRRGDFSAARAEYEKAYDLDPRNPATCAEIGQAWAAEGRYTEAEIWLHEAISLAPQDPRLWDILARFYLEHGLSDNERLTEALNTLLVLAPGEGWVYELQGWAAFQAGEYETARKSFLRAISLDPMLASAHYRLGLVYKATGLHEQALESFTRASDLDTSGVLRPLIERAMGYSASIRGP